MGRMPDLSGIIYFAAVGIFCTTVATLLVGGWLAYHLVMAIVAYLGVAH